MKTGFIGGGNMAEAMIKGMISRGMKDILVSEPAEERRAYLQKTLNVTAIGSNRELVSSCGIIVLAVKPQNMSSVLEEIKETVTEDRSRHKARLSVFAVKDRKTDQSNAEHPGPCAGGNVGHVALRMYS